MMRALEACLVEETERQGGWRAGGKGGASRGEEGRRVKKGVAR